MSKQILIPIEIKVPEEELGLLWKTLEFSREREKNAVRFIQKTAMRGAIAHAASTIDVHDWKEIQVSARNLGVESPV